MDSVLPVTLACWLVNYNAHVAECVAEFLGHQTTCAKRYKSIELRTPSGAFIRCVQVNPQSRVMDIAAMDELLYLKGQFENPLESIGSLWDLVKEGDSMTVMKQPFQWSPNKVFDCQDEANSVSWHPTKNQLVSGLDTNVQLWDLDVIPSIPTTIHESDNMTLCVSFNPSGKYLAMGDSVGIIRIVSMVGTRSRHTLPDHLFAVNSISWHPTRNWLLSGSEDQTVRIWDIESFQCIHTCHDHCNAVNSVHWHPDGTRFASGSDDGTIRIWNMRGDYLETLSTNLYSTLSVQWHPTKQWLASAHDFSTIQIWNTTLSECIHVFRDLSQRKLVRCVRWHPSGKYLASGSDNGQIQIWCTTKWILHTTLGNKSDSSLLYSIEWHPNGNSIASASSDEIVQIWS